MKDQHTKITGYRDLTQAEIDMMNKIKAHAAAIESLLAEVQAHINGCFKSTEQYISLEEEAALDPTDAPTGMVKTPAAEAEWNRLIAAEPHRWLGEAKTDLQTGLMALTRAVAQPTTF